MKRQQEIAHELLTVITLSSEIAVFRIRLDPIHFGLPDPIHETDSDPSSKELNQIMTNSHNILIN